MSPDLISPHIRIVMSKEWQNEQEEPGLPSGELQSGPAGIPAAGKDLQG